MTRFTRSSCRACHLRLAAEHDSVCAFVVGPEGLGLAAEPVQGLQSDVAVRG